MDYCLSVPYKVSWFLLWYLCIWLLEFLFVHGTFVLCLQCAVFYDEGDMVRRDGKCLGHSSGIV